MGAQTFNQVTKAKTGQQPRELAPPSLPAAGGGEGGRMSGEMVDDSKLTPIQTLETDAKQDLTGSTLDSIMGVGNKPKAGNTMNRGMADDRSLAMGYRTPKSHILTGKEIESIKKDAQAIKVPVSVLRFNEGTQTGFRDRTALIYIRGDILPDKDSTIARDRMSMRAVLAHEYYGHYKHHPSEYEAGDWHDEFRASYTAATDAPNLSDEDRALLMIDAYDRAKEAGVILEYDEKARKIIYGY